MAFKDLREWIDFLDTENELKMIKTEVDWYLEIGAVSRKVLDINGPALLFENIKGYKNTICRKLFTGSLGTYQRISLMLGMKKDASIKELIEVNRKRFRERISPVLSKSGSVKENIIEGDKIDLYQFPVPHWQKLDGGRYINTLCGIVTRDPETNIQNVGLYRGMIADKDKISVSMNMSKQWGVHFSKYREMNKTMPVAIAYGSDPVLGYTACASVPQDICEYEIMGSLRQAPVELVKCETCDLEVPATSEIVIEGYISPDPSTYELEGPFGEYTGYFGGARSKKPTIKVECITHRNEPIFQGTLEGLGPGHPNEDALMCQIHSSALAWNVLESSGIPGIRDVYVLPGSYWQTLAVSIRKTYRGQAKQVAMSIWGSRFSLTRCKNIIVVDDDIDIHNFDSIEWALAYRLNPMENDLVVVPGMPGSTLDPSIRKEERNPMKYGTGKTNRLLIDATKNWEYGRREEWGDDFYPPLAFTLGKEEEELVKRRWKEYGF